LTNFDIQRLKEPERFRRYHPRLDKYLYRIQAFSELAKETLKDTKPLAIQLSSAPIKFATDKGRLIASEVALQKAGVDFKRFDIDNSTTRLPEPYSTWEGRLDANGKPFPYEEVKKPKTFRVVGGGIHFGETAELSGSIDLREAALVYEPAKGLIIRDGKSGTEWVIDNSLDPTGLKALYRFAASGRNAAISIGWGTEALSVVETDRTGEPVLLDPYLVDTKVGQDLILADNIPWDLGKGRLPNGKPISFAEKFNQLSLDYSADDRNKLTNFVSAIKPFETLVEEVKAAKNKAIFWDVVRRPERLFELSEEKGNRPVFELWCAWQKKQGQEPRKIAEALYALTNPTTLAVLYDDSVRVNLNKDRLQLTTQLRYLYATSYLQITDNYIGKGTSPANADNEVKRLDDLTDLVNNRVTQLVESFPPLQRVKRYAEIAAFFRWAQKAAQDGRLGVIDMSELGPYPANDRVKYPTIDVLKR